MHRPAAALAVSALAAVSHAQAQETPAAQPARLAPVAPAAPPASTVEVKAAANYDPRRDDTASKIVVGRDEILKYGDQTVLDVLKRLPGVTVAGGSVRMRGLSGYTQFLLNGERPPAGFSLDSLAPESIEKIEIVRSATAEFSTQAIAGTINVVLKKSVEKGAREFRGGAGFARHYLSPGGNLSVSDKNGRTSWSFNINVARSDFDGDSTALESGTDAQGRPNLRRDIVALDSSIFNGVNIGGRINWTLPGGDTVTWQTFLNANRTTSVSRSRSTTTLGEAQADPNTDSDAEAHAASLRSDLSWVAKLGNSAKLETKVGLSASGNDRSSRVLGFDEPEFIKQDRFGDVTAHDAGFTSTGKYSRPLFEGHAAAAGWDAGFTRRNTDNILDDTIWLAPPPQGQPVRDDVRQTYTAQIARLAVYAQDEWNLTPRFSLYLGGRWEGVRTRSEGSGFTPITTQTSVFSPLVHTLWKIPGTKSDQVRLALTRTYRPPSAYALTPRRSLSINNSQTSPDYQGNPALKPELATGIDLSYEHYIGNDGALLSASFSNRSIDQFNRSALQLIGERWVVTPSNVGQAHTRGIELEAKFPLKAVYATSLPLDLRASVSRHWSSVDSVPGPDNRLDNQTPLSASLGADYKAGQLTAGASFTFSNGGWVRTAINEWSYTSVERNLEAYALWKFDAHLALRVAVLNVLAGDSTPATLYRDASGSLYQRSVTPPMLRGRILIEYKF